MNNLGDLFRLIYFLAAFFSVVWIVSLFLYWIFLPSITRVTERRSVKNKYSGYLRKRGVGNYIIRCVFVIVNAHHLYPIQAIVIALLIIISFIYF